MFIVRRPGPPCNWLGYWGAAGSEGRAPPHPWKPPGGFHRRPRKHSAVSSPHTYCELPKCVTRFCLISHFPSCLQIEMLSPYEAVAERFKEQYKTFATALDTTRHELPVKSVHLDGDGQRFLGRKRDGCWARGRSSEWPMQVGASCVPATFIHLCHITTSCQVDGASLVKW